MLKYMFLMQRHDAVHNIQEPKKSSIFQIHDAGLNPILQHIKLQKHEETTFSLYKHVKNVKVYVPYAKT